MERCDTIKEMIELRTLVWNGKSSYYNILGYNTKHGNKVLQAHSSRQNLSHCGP